MINKKVFIFNETPKRKENHDKIRMQKRGKKEKYKKEEDWKELSRETKMKKKDKWKKMK